MIDLYTWTTPNGRKASIALEELGLPYTVHPIDIGKDEQLKPEFLKISPNNRIPAIVDRENGISLMESGAILIYLADKTGKLLPKSGEGHYRVLEWLMWQMGGPGPMFGQVHHFVKYNKGKAPYAGSASAAASIFGPRGSQATLFMARSGCSSGWWIVRSPPHVPVWDKSARPDGTFSRVDFVFDRERNVYTWACNSGQKHPKQTS